MRRSTSDHGTTLVEYVLMVAMLCVVTIGALQVLEAALVDTIGRVFHATSGTESEAAAPPTAVPPTTVPPTTLPPTTTTTLPPTTTTTLPPTTTTTTTMPPTTTTTVPPTTTTTLPPTTTTTCIRWRGRVWC